MSGRGSSSKSGLFLIELIIAILFFAITSAICMQLFVKSHMVGQKSNELSMAVMETQTVAETLKAGRSLADFSQRFPEFLHWTGEYRWELWYNKEWIKVKEEQNTFYKISVEMLPSSRAGLWEGSVSAFREAQMDTPFYQLEVKKYFPSGEGAFVP